MPPELNGHFAHQPGRFVLAIECDGASYHLIPTVRERDRIRQRHLQDLGWKFHRIWSTDWFQRREHEIKDTERAYQDAVNFAAKAQDGDVPPTLLNEESSLSPPGAQVGKRVGKGPRLFFYGAGGGYNDEAIIDFGRWVMSDGVRRTQDDLALEMAKLGGVIRKSKVLMQRLTRLAGIVIKQLENERSSGP